MICDITKEIKQKLLEIENLGLKALCYGYFGGNEKSVRAQTKCGFKNIVEFHLGFVYRG